jgi:aminoglycoside phosphotransferase family enzyme
MPHAFSIPTGARKRLGTTVRALHQPAAYPGNEAPEETIETHMAWVFLTSSHAYKLKKPIQDRLIDYHTAADRRRACRTEVALNRRLAAPVYLGTVPVAHTTRGLRVGGTGPPVDWLVKMRRLPRAQMLDVRIRHGRVQRARIHALAALLTRFYRAARPAHWSQAEYRGRLLANLTAKRTSLQHPRYRLPPRLLRSVAQAQLRWLRTHVAHLEARAPRVVDAHGDLRPEHVCLTSPPLVIDCLEFNRTLRLLDPLSELAFLSLECRRLGAAWIGPALIASYRQRSGDDAPGRLISFYESYHATVRAAIAVWHLDDDTPPDAARWRRQAITYLRLARDRL